MSLILHYHPLSSCCWKVLIALYEKGLPFEPRMLSFDTPAARAAFVALWPTGKFPLLQHGDHVVPETSIIIEYLDQQFDAPPSLLPGAPEQQLEVRLCDRLSDLYVMQPLQRFVGELLKPEADRLPQTLQAARDELSMAYGLFERRLAGRTWAAGEAFSLADCALAPALFYASVIQPLPTDACTLAAYFERLIARDSVGRVIVEARPWFHLFPMHASLPARFLADAG